MASLSRRNVSTSCESFSSVPVELAELVAGATIKRRLRSKQSIQRRLTKKQPPPRNSLPQSSNPASETVPDIEEHPVVPERTEPSEVEEHPVVPERTEPWRPDSLLKSKKCATLRSHGLHRELGHSDIRGCDHAHLTVLAAAKLMHCTACKRVPECCLVL